MAGLHSRVIVILDENGTVTYTRTKFPEIANRQITSYFSIIKIKWRFQKITPLRSFKSGLPFWGAYKLISTEHSIMVPMFFGLNIRYCQLHLRVSTRMAFQILSLSWFKLLKV
jgi:hypothetical protein